MVDLLRIVVEDDLGVGAYPKSVAMHFSVLIEQGKVFVVLCANTRELVLLSRRLRFALSRCDEEQCCLCDLFSVGVSRNSLPCQ